MALATVCGTTPAQTAVKICPLGDSILESFTTRHSPRFYLDKLLRSGGYAFDFVGHNYGVFAGPPADDNFDQNHEAYGGWRIDHHLLYLEDRLRNTRPDIVLIHLGTNDLISRHTTDNSIEELGECIDVIRAVNPYATVLVSQIIPMGIRDVVPFNEAIPDLVASKDRPESRVVVVDHYTPFDYATHMTIDGLHPNDTGEQLMAEVWYDALLPFLTPADDEFATFGQGCEGDADDEPEIVGIRGQAASLGNPFSLRIEDLPEDSLLFGFMGFSATEHFGLPLPADLSPLGAPNCSLLVGPDLSFTLGMFVTDYLWTLPVPNDEILVGNSFYLQALVIGDYNSLGLLTSNAAKITVVAGRR